MTLAGQGHSAKACCRMLGVAPSGYFYWQTRPPSIRQLRQGQLDDLVADIHRASNGTYGKRRITAELRLGHGMTVNLKAVKAAMRRLGIQGLPAPKRKRRGPQTNGATASDLVARQFARDAPNQLWLTDITEHPTREGKLYCCAVLDAHSRRVIGWSIDSRQATSLVTSALAMAVKNRKPPNGTIVHCDHDSQAGLNWSSQHLDRGGVYGQASWVDDGVDGQGADEVAGASDASAGCRAAVLA